MFVEHDKTVVRRLFEVWNTGEIMSAFGVLQFSSLFSAIASARRAESRPGPGR